MVLVYQGELDLLGISPLVVNCTLPAFANLNTQLAGAVAIQASLSVTPPTLAATIVATEAVLANLQASASAGLPNVSFNLSATASLIATLQANIALLSVLQGVLSAGNFFAWTYSGTGAAFGGTLTSALATTWPDSTPSSATGQAVVLATLNPASWTALVGGGPGAAFLGGL